MENDRYTPIEKLRSMDNGRYTPIWNLNNSKCFSILQWDPYINDELSILNHDIQVVSSLLSRNEFEIGKISRAAAVMDLRKLKEIHELTDMELDFVLNCNRICLSNLEQFLNRLTKYKDFLISVHEH